MKQYVTETDFNHALVAFSTGTLRQTRSSLRRALNTFRKVARQSLKLFENVLVDDKFYGFSSGGFSEPSDPRLRPPPNRHY